MYEFSLGNKISLFGFYALGFANSDLGSGGAAAVSPEGAALAERSAVAAEVRRNS